MDEDKHRRMAELIEQIRIEQDHKKFTTLIDELNCLLDETELPKYLPISPIALSCPRCKAKPGIACHKVSDEAEVVHLERIAAAAAEDIKSKKDRKNHQ